VVAMLQKAVDSFSAALGLPFGVRVDGVSSAHTQHGGAALGAAHAMTLASNDVLAVMHMHICAPSNSSAAPIHTEGAGSGAGALHRADQLERLQTNATTNATNSTGEDAHREEELGWATQFACSLPAMKESGALGDLLGEIVIPELGVMTWGLTQEILCPDASVYADLDASPPPAPSPLPTPTPSPAPAPGPEDGSATKAFGGADFSEAEEGARAFPLFKGTPFRQNASRNGTLMDADPQEPFTNAFSPAEANSSGTAFQTAPLQARERLALGMTVAIVVLATLLAIWQVARYWRAHKVPRAAAEAYVPYTPDERGESTTKGRFEPR